MTAILLTAAAIGVTLGTLTAVAMTLTLKLYKGTNL